MHPTDSYYKTKRNLLIFVGALLLAVFAGLKLEGASVNDSLLPIKIDHPEWLRVILTVGVAFNVYQLSLLWAAQDSRVQENRFHRIDFLGAVFIAVASIFSLGAVEMWPLVRRTADSHGWTWLLSVFTSSLLTVIAVFFSQGTLHLATAVGRKIKGRSRDRENTQRDVLVRSNWLLHYDPRGRKAKAITFNSDGTVGDGQNQNEHNWRMTDGLLEILNDKGAVFSRFRYDEEKERFTHTNDEDTSSLRNQTIEYVSPITD
ncbi:MAG: hypothetical protein WD341_15900 [Tistlia sp.]|uniref:hypothetical protein n=1 Tax=Tistlia sp. TaxID=3057121 RepID=UPI0034A314D5